MLLEDVHPNCPVQNLLVQSHQVHNPMAHYLMDPSCWVSYLASQWADYSKVW